MDVVVMLKDSLLEQAMEENCEGNK